MTEASEDFDAFQKLNETPMPSKDQDKKPEEQEKL
jgi:hypothetical protein